MAGSDEFKEELSRAERNKQIRDARAADPELAAAKRAKVGEGYDLEGYTDEQVAKAFQGESFGDKDYARLTGKPVGDDQEVSIPEQPVGNPEPTPGDNPGGPIFTPPNGPNQGITPPVYGFGPGGQNINQDNDIVSNVTGDNNNVNNNQDNSIRGYGGRNSSFKDAWMKDYFS